MATAVLDGKHIELKDVFNLLESTETQINKSIKTLIQDNLSSTKEPWLIHSLVDYYYATRSRNVISILRLVQDPHDKNLMEKLHDGIKSQDFQLPALQLLLQIVHKQPTYLKLIVSTQVLKVVIKCLKADHNIPVLMTAVTIVTILLPSIPTLVGTYLPDIFEIFNRLASFSVKKPPGNAPDIFLLHLQISVYALFHRLYGMFPYTFLAYLRHYYTKKENTVVFEEVIKISVYALFHRLYGMFPYTFLAYLRHYYTKKENTVVFEEVIKGMLERVRLHPLLITGNKDQEVSSQRWRQMETHDVVVECAKMSLDPIEGTWEELHCPVIASRQLIGRPVSPNKEQAQARCPAQQVSAKLSILSSQDGGAVSDLAAFWSPSEIIGLSTPPPSQRATPAKAALDTATTSSTHTGPHVLVQTPQNTPRETPTIPDDQEKIRSRNNSRGPLQPRPADPKRLSSEFSHITAPQLTPVPQLTPSSHAQSVPPSPLKTEFTNLPPLGIQTLQPVYNAARELQFDRDHPEEQHQQGFKPLPSHVITLGQPGGKTVAGSEVKSGSEPMGEGKSRKEEGQQRVGGEMEAGARSGGGATSAEGRDGLEATVSMDTLSQVIENLDSDAGDDDDNDDEVSELTSNSRSGGNVSNLTAESVAKFMKSVNRIRFNSLTVTNDIEPVVKKMGIKHRSRSCPQFPKMAEEEEEISRSASTTFEDSTQIETESESVHEASEELTIKIKSKEPSPDVIEKPETGGVAVTSSVKQEVTVTMTTTQTTTCDVKVAQCPVYQQSVAGGRGKEGESEFVQLLQQVLNPVSVTCDKCRGAQDTGKMGVSSHFTTFSPPELLDRHIKLGGDIHAKELSKIPIPSTQNVNWTHFGGVPPADEISILRGQLTLLHNQLLYERHKREQHAKRNRRLLRKIANTKMLEEHNKAKSLQLEQHEETIRNLHVSVQLLQQENCKLKNTCDSEEYEKLVQLKSCLQENEDLKNVKKEFNMLLVRQREEQEALEKKLKKTESSLFNAKKELETMEQHATMNLRLKDQLLNQQKELLLMGELQQKSQEKLLSNKVSRKSLQEQEKAQASLRKQIEGLKNELARKQTQLEGCQKQLHEAQESLSTKDIAQSELKLTLESLKTSQSDQVKSVEDKYQSVLRINQALETQISQLYMEIEEHRFTRAQEARRKKSPTPKTPENPVDSSGSTPTADTTLRERSGSDPLLHQEPHRVPLMRMISSPAEGSTSTSTITDLGLAEGQRSFVVSSDEHTIAGESSPYIVLEESRESDLHHFLNRSGEEHDRSETVSLSSHDSTLYPGQQHMMYTDSEDNRSSSNRSSRLGDSGFC